MSVHSDVLIVRLIPHIIIIPSVCCRMLWFDDSINCSIASRNSCRISGSDAEATEPHKMHSHMKIDQARSETDRVEQHMLYR